jgi:H+-translocating NAD(P) transhydrogenase subunit alpha
MSFLPNVSLLSAATAVPTTTPELTANLLIMLLTIFVLAVFVGFEIITKVPPTLHTPLMSGSNAISGITIIGALVVSRPGAPWFMDILAFLAVVLATINVVGGYLVTDRMLAMFRRRR